MGTGTERCWMDHVQVISTAKQLHMMSMVPRTGGENTKVTLSGGDVQFGIFVVKAVARAAESKSPNAPLLKAILTGQTQYLVMKKTLRL